MNGISVYIYTVDLEPIHTTDLPAVPSKGDYITVHGEDYEVKVVSWELDAEYPSVQLRCKALDGGGE